MFATLKVAVRPAFPYLWPRNHLLRFFSVSSKSQSSWSTDPETRRRQYDDYLAKRNKKYAQSADVREKALSRVRATKAAWNEADARKFRQRTNFYRWVARGLKQGHVRSWKTHTPELVDRSNVRLCSGCSVLLRKTLWWKRNNDSEDHYECSPCFMKDWSRVNPIGHEHLTWLSEPSKSKQESDAASSGTSDNVESRPESKP